jgi:hypothetical protein
MILALTSRSEPIYTSTVPNPSAGRQRSSPMTDPQTLDERIQRLVGGMAHAAAVTSSADRLHTWGTHFPANEGSNDHSSYAETLSVHIDPPATARAAFPVTDTGDKCAGTSLTAVANSVGHRSPPRKRPREVGPDLCAASSDDSESSGSESSGESDTAKFRSDMRRRNRVLQQQIFADAIADTDADGRTNVNLVGADLVAPNTGFDAVATDDAGAKQPACDAALANSHAAAPPLSQTGQEGKR